MEELTQRIALAKADAREMDALVRDYLPFIKGQIAKVNAPELEYDDKLSLGMLVFLNCVRQYSGQRGGLIPFATVCIRNRLLDECKKLQRHGAKRQPLIANEEEHGTSPAETAAATAQYDKQQEQQDLKREIEALAAALAEHELSFATLAKCAPRQKRSRELCARLAKAVAQDGEMKEAFAKSRRLPQAQLAAQQGVSQKTVEKHRRYIVALVLVFAGDYPGIGAYIPGYQEVAI